MLLMAVFPISLSAADFVSRDYDAHIAELVHARLRPIG